MSGGETSRIVADPSVSALAFQAGALSDALQTITEDEHPEEAIRIRDAYLAVVRRIASILLAITAKGTPISFLDAQRARSLGRVVHEMYSHVRYLYASDPRRASPGIQAAIRQFVSTYFGHMEPKSVIALVRPQWRYNLRFVDLLGSLDLILEVSAFNVDGLPLVDATNFKELVEQLEAAEARNKGAAAPVPLRHVAILSFAGLDTEDALLYPVLAHEFGHFLDVSFPGTIHDNPAVVSPGWLPTLDSLARAVDSFRQGEGGQRDLFWDAYLARLYNNSVVLPIKACLRELAADLLATRTTGLAFFLAQAELLKSISDLAQPLVLESGYPGAGFRLLTSWRELTDPTDGLGAIIAFREFASQADAEGFSDGARIARFVADLLDEWGRRLPAAALAPASEPRSIDDAVALIVQNAVQAALPPLTALVRQVVPRNKAAVPHADVLRLVEQLRARIPPFQQLVEAGLDPKQLRNYGFADILAATWTYELAEGEAQEERAGGLADQRRVYDYTCRLALKALELFEVRDTIARVDRAVEKHDSPFLPAPTAGHRSTGFVSGPDLIREYMERAKLDDRVTVVPFVDWSVVQAASLDLRLGNWFRVWRRTKMPKLDLADPDQRRDVRVRGQQEVYVLSNDVFVLHPGDLVLGCSLEYLTLPRDVVGSVEGKSSLGRAGLVIATAAHVAPGFKGVIVLELANTGSIPIILRPAMRIAQLVLIRASEAVPVEWCYQGAFQGQTRP